MINERNTGILGLRPLSPRSIVLSVLLGSHPPSMPVGRLVEFTALFGIAEGSVRTALSRMVASGELDATDGIYRLSGRLLVRQVQQDAGRAGPPPVWDNTWWFAAVVADRRTVNERRDFRSQAIDARLGELRPGIWIRPANIAVPSDLPDVAITRGPLVAGDPCELVARLWDLDQMERHAVLIVDALDGTLERLAGKPAGRDGDIVLADAFIRLAEAQRFLRSEPQLPDRLAPTDTIVRLRGGYATAVAAFQSRLGEFFGRVGSR